MYRNITSPEKFAASFNQKFPGAYRLITAEDVNDMTECGLIGRYGFYLKKVDLSERYGFNKQDDLETIRGILQYEQLRENRPVPPALEDEPEPPKCKKCDKPLPVKPRDKKGRLREYCSECELLRNRDRQRKLSDRRRKQHHKSLSMKTTPSPRQLHCEPGQ